jgi:hypothetical protein
MAGLLRIAVASAALALPAAAAQAPVAAPEAPVAAPAPIEAALRAEDAETLRRALGAAALMTLMEWPGR